MPRRLTLTGSVQLRRNDTCIHQVFEAQVARCPDSPALALGSATISYRELNRRANRLARMIHQRGIGPDTPVAVFTRRSFDTLTAVLGALKAGTGYLALDPAYPPDRLAFMVSDSGTPLILTQQHLAESVPAGDAAHISLDIPGEPTSAEDDVNPEFPVDPDQLAYLLYTSGSTGKPKGVLVTHRNLVHSTEARTQYYLDPVQSFLLLSSFAFDSSVAGIFWTLCSGGTLVIADESLQRDPAGIARSIQEHRISHLLTVPSLYGLILDELQTAGPIPLRAAIVAGETCPLRLVQRHDATLPDTALYNEYGPTEATVWCSVFDCSDPIAGNRVPIGRPIVDTRMHVLDDRLHPVPDGSAGELFVGGAGVTRGYLNQPDLTTEKFVPDPFHPQDGARLYRTGDLARLLPDGNFEYLGRIDQQVKVRGYRVEPGEIEATLRTHREVTDAVVAPQESASGNMRLVAYVVPRRTPWPSGNELLAFLRTLLPEHMVPSTVVLLAAFPLLPNGKIDRHALPPAGGERPALQHPYVPPRDGVEARLAAIWADVLGVDEVGREDDFFELGGDSLLSMQIVARARRQGLGVSSEHIAQHRTIARLAAHVQTGNPTVDSEQGPVSGAAPITPRQQKYFEEDHAAGGWIEQTALDLLAPIDPPLLEDALRRVVSHHDALRLRFMPTTTGWRQRFLPDEPNGLLTAVDALQSRGSEWQAALAETQARAAARIDVERGPLVQAAYLRRTRKPSRLFLFLHHLVVDAYSIPILLEDLETACLAALQGSSPVFPPKTTSYRTWAQHLAAWADTAAARAELDYWCRQAGGPEIPVDFSATGNDVGLLQYVMVGMTADETDAIVHDLPRAFGLQINDILLAALILGFSWRTHSRTLRIDLSTHGREPIFEDVDVSRTVGWFASAFPLRLTVDSTSDPIDAARQVQQQLATLPHAGLGYGALRYLARDASTRARLADIPPPTVGLNYQGRSGFLNPGSRLFALRRKLTTRAPSTPVPRSSRLPVSGHLHEGRLYLRIRYHDRVYRRETIERIAAETAATLRVMVANCHTSLVSSSPPQH